MKLLCSPGAGKAPPTRGASRVSSFSNVEYCRVNAPREEEEEEEGLYLRATRKRVQTNTGPIHCGRGDSKRLPLDLSRFSR